MSSQRFFIQGKVGQVECLLDLPTKEPIALALLAHPHPVYGGTMDNKVVETLARTLSNLGCVCARLNFRGVGASDGVYDEGIGETEDMELLLNHMQKQYDLPIVLAGYSFGTYVIARLQRQLEKKGQNVSKMIFISAAAGMFDLGEIPKASLVIHGEVDTMIPLKEIFKWLAPQDIPVVVAPGTDHFYNRKLHHIMNTINKMWS